MNKIKKIDISHKWKQMKSIDSLHVLVKLV